VPSFRPIALPLVLLLAGCVTATREERLSLARVQETGALLHPAASGPARPELTADSSLADYLRYALLHHPQVEAAYDEWRGAALAIAPARALPDPKLTFQADITDNLTSLMPGLMFDFMSGGKREAMAREALAASEVAYRRYAAAVLETAADVKHAWVDLTALEETLRLKQQMLDLTEDAIRFSHAEHVTMHATGSLDDLTRLLNDAGRLRLEVTNLGDQRGALRARFKAALGIAREAPDPPWPAQFAPTAAPLPDDDAFWAAARATNPRLAEMRAMVEMAVAEVSVEQKARTPDLAAGLMADLKMNPVLWRPLAEVTLPVWRGKIDDAIAAARARHDAAAARLRAEELMVAADLARMTYMVREADRMVAYLDGTALPNLRRSLASVTAAYDTGMTGFAAIPETQEMILALQVERVAALREREQTLADLSLLVAGQAPAGAPLPVATASSL
jgi:outer membrane protein TolC